MKDLLKLINNPLRTTGEYYFDCGHRKHHNDRHKICQKCRNAGGYIQIKDRGSRGG